MHKSKWSMGLAVSFSRARIGTVSLLLIGLCCCLPSARGEAVTPEGLKGASELIEQVVEKVNPAVVEIEVKSVAVRELDKDPDASANLTHDHCMGTGVILTPAGEILTNHHVVRGARQITVHVFGSTKSYSARIIGDDPQADLALLKIDGSGFSHFELGAGKDVRQGQIVLAMGNPFGFEHSVTLGLISSRSRELDNGAPTSYIQTDAPINPGNSGGPLVDLDGNLVGINTLIYSLSGGSEGVGFAIPVDTVRHAVTALEKYGSVQRPYLGVSLQLVTETIAQGLNLTRNDGLLVDDIDAGSPASMAGLVPGDVIIGVQGEPISDWKSFRNALEAVTVGYPLLLRIERHRSEKTVAIKPLYDRPPHLDLLDYANVSQDTIHQVGIVAVSLNGNVRRLFPETRSPDGIVIAAKWEAAGYDTDVLEVGDILHEVNGRPIHDAAEFRSYLLHFPPHEPLVLQVERMGDLKYIPITTND
jgi:serine protease Do